jgi:imidazole glycerol-phosphate synthase subunit HisH
MTKEVVVIDYGMGNLRSVAKALERVSPKSRVTISNEPAAVQRAERVVFPGQGAMPDCMAQLREHGLHEAVLKAAHEKPFLGICIGQQMLFEHSEEGDVDGLGLMQGRVVRFPLETRTPDGLRLKVPHMGWNHVLPTHPEHPLWQGIEPGARFYFVHSYHVVPAHEQEVAAYTDYGQRFTSAVTRANIIAVQFHPEKSAAAGLSMLGNFMNWDPQA